MMHSTIIFQLLLCLRFKPFLSYVSVNSFEDRSIRSGPITTSGGRLDVPVLVLHEMGMALPAE